MSNDTSVKLVVLALDSPHEIPSVVEEIQQHPNFKVLATATSVRELEEAIVSSEHIDIIITDVFLKGRDACNSIRKATLVHDDIEIIVYTEHESEQIVMRAIQMGASGYLLKNDVTSLPNCMLLLSGGGAPVSPHVARSVLRAIRARHADDFFSDPSTRKNNLEGASPLSRREMDILHLLSKGMSFSEIGNILDISPHTVTAHVKKLYRKLQVHSRGEAVYEATCMGILKNE